MSHNEGAGDQIIGHDKDLAMQGITGYCPQTGLWSSNYMIDDECSEQSSR